MEERHVGDSSFRGRMRSFAPLGGRPPAPPQRPSFHAVSQHAPVHAKPLAPPQQMRSVDGFSVPRPAVHPAPAASSQAFSQQSHPRPVQPPPEFSPKLSSNRPDRTHHNPTHARSIASPRQHKSAVLRRQSVQKSAREIYKVTRKRRLNPAMVMAISAAVFAIGVGAAGYAFWTVRKGGQVAGSQTTNTETVKDSPFESPPSVAEYKNHTSQSDLPRYVRIPGLRINARAKQVSYSPSSGLETPVNIYDIGWYGQSGRPNDEKAMVFSVRSKGVKADSPYVGLDKLKPGNFIEVEQGDGNKLFYKVVSSSPVEPGKFNMAIASASADSKKQGLNVISYSPTGPEASSYEPTLIVYAIRM